MNYDLAITILTANIMESLPDDTDYLSVRKDVIINKYYPEIISFILDRKSSQNIDLFLQDIL